MTQGISNLSSAEVIVVGGGPAGLMAAIQAGQRGRSVVLIEKNFSFAPKLLLTGHGRCNITNTSSREEYFARLGPNAEFLRDAFVHFFHPQLIKFYESRGLPIKQEAEGRCFPATEKAADVARILTDELQLKNVRIQLGKTVQQLLIGDGRIQGVQYVNGKVISSSSVVLATGGLSYPQTGSTGDGLRFAEQSGHQIVSPRPGLAGLVCQVPRWRDLKGISLYGVGLRLILGKKILFDRVGDIMATHYGLSGPVVLNASNYVSAALQAGKPVEALIDFIPATTSDQLRASLAAAGNAGIGSALNKRLTRRLVDFLLDSVKISPQKKISELNQKNVEHILDVIKNFAMPVTASLPLESAMITLGGVSLKDIDPRTMQSRKVQGLFFAGEIMDIAGESGGFNLQAAFSTGYVAGHFA
ncbi:MAG: NAD(P)/FAD-dependent oxidoreductase [Candidatus Omnitrophica bacterium]|nr:NAD(P)/FAD-dependent oxidoreductase [Candidatus Omnitrophota bacterium]